MKILTNKQYNQLIIDLTQSIEKKVCQQSGTHTFYPVYSKKRNNHKPEYMIGDVGAEIHNIHQDIMCVDEIYEHSVCRYCGIKNK